MPSFHYAHLIPVAGDQVVDVADCRRGFKRNRKGPKIAEEFRGVEAVGGGEQYGNISPDRRLALFTEMLQTIQGGSLIQADDYGQTDWRHAVIVATITTGMVGSA